MHTKRFKRNAVERKGNSLFIISVIINTITANDYFGVTTATTTTTATVTAVITTKTIATKITSTIITTTTTTVSTITITITTIITNLANHRNLSAGT